jgi:uncharacterized damage-inducible protein DinB
MMKTVKTLTRYKAWANDLIFAAVSELPQEEAVRPRRTRYRNMVHTLNHVYVIDSLFKAHLLGREHGFAARNTPDHPPLAELWQQVRTLDNWYVEYSDVVSAQELDRSISFTFIGGGSGVMTCSEMLVHVVNHGTYHRGLVADMMYQAGVTPPTTDLPVFLRDAA